MLNLEEEYYYLRNYNIKKLNYFNIFLAYEYIKNQIRARDFIFKYII